MPGPFPRGFSLFQGNFEKQGWPFFSGWRQSPLSPIPVRWTGGWGWRSVCARWGAAREKGGWNKCFNFYIVNSAGLKKHRQGWKADVGFDLTYKARLFWKMSSFKENPTSPPPSFSLSQTLWRVIPRVFKGPDGCLWVESTVFCGGCLSGADSAFGGAGWRWQCEAGWNHFTSSADASWHEKKNQTWRSYFYLKISVLRLCVCMFACTCVPQTSLWVSPSPLVPSSLRIFTGNGFPRFTHVLHRHVFLTSYFPWCQGGQVD